MSAVIVRYDTNLTDADRIREAGYRAEAILLYEPASVSRPERVYGP